MVIILSYFCFFTLLEYQIEVVGGDITEMNVDVLVNAANRQLQHSGGLAGVIAKKGRTLFLHTIYVQY